MKDEEILDKLSRTMSRFAAPVPVGFADKVMARIEDQWSFRKAVNAWLEDFRVLQWEASLAAIAIFVVAFYSSFSTFHSVTAAPEVQIRSGDHAQAVFESDDLEGISDE